MLPQVATVQLDNASPNHSMLVFGFCAQYVLFGIFEKFRVRFELVPQPVSQLRTLLFAINRQALQRVLDVKNFVAVALNRCCISCVCCGAGEPRSRHLRPLPLHPQDRSEEEDLLHMGGYDHDHQELTLDELAVRG